MKKKPAPPEPVNEPYMVGYARVSTDDQNLDLQIDALRKAGVRDDNIHTEHISGAAKKRPALDLAIMDLRPGDTLVVWRLDRLSRSMRDLYQRLDQIFEAGASFKSLQENFDFTTAIGKLYLAIAGAFAEFERQLTSQRTKAGIAALKARGGTYGRRPVVTGAKKQAILAMLRKHDADRKPTYRIIDVADKFDLAVSSIYGHWTIKRNKNGSRAVIDKQ